MKVKYLIFILITGVSTLYAGVPGSLSGAFSVSSTKKVYFSQGNLQYSTSNSTWSFVSTQYGGKGTSFGWGTGNNPTQSSTNNSDYTTFVDWGVNEISNGGNQANLWRTLSKTEWDYIMTGRTNASNLVSKGTVNNVHGFILLPDNWSLPSGLSFTIGKPQDSWTVNNYTIADWQKMEQNGAIFLPVTEINGTITQGGIITYTDIGQYWTSSSCSTTNAYDMRFYRKSTIMSTSFSTLGVVKSKKCYVRLVIDSDKNVAYTITWKNYDNTTLATTNVVKGVTPTYTGSTPTRPADAQYEYVFSGWTPAITAATANKTYTATYTQTTRKYNITFVNADGVQIGIVQQIEYGQNATPPTPPSRDGYTFSGWIGRYVHVQYDATIYASYKIRNEVLPGLFSISNTEKVYFSQGNLQYYAASGTHSCADDTSQPGTWRFAEHQFDYIGNGNAGISSSYVGWIDLFGWGTSGWNSGASAYQPYSTSEINSDYYPGNSPSNNLIGAYQYADWGIYNAIYNGGNQPNQWRTLTGEQIGYLYSGRENAAMKRSPATINSITGYIFLPDNWVLPSGVTFTADASDYTSNDYSLAEWDLMEKHGAVFLPSAGYRCNGIVPTSSLIMGDYWASTVYCADYANRLMTRTDIVRAGVDSKEERHYGFSVRLVKDVNVYTITFNAAGGIIPTDGNMGNTPVNHVTTLSVDRTSGTVMVVAGFKYFNAMSGDCPTREGYVFEGWYTDPISGEQVYDVSGQSIEGAYWNSSKQWIGTSDLTLYAHWTPLAYTISTSATNGTVTGGGTFDYGTNHQLTATPNECYQFTQWTDGNTNNPRTITVTGAATYTAEFEKIKYTIRTEADNVSQGSATVE